MAVCPFHAESLTMAQRFAGPWSLPRPTRDPAGQPAYSQFVTQAASARGWFFAKNAEPATKTPITRASATIFVMSPPAPPGSGPSRGANIDAAHGGSERSRGR